MKNDNKILEDKLPRNCCTFCSHLSLEGPDENYRYYIKCVLSNKIPSPTDCCEFFDQEHTNLTTCDLDYLYLDFLETSLRIKYEDYLNSLYWHLFKDRVLKNHNYTCSMCNSREDVDVYHINKKLGRENEEDVIVLCSKCFPKYSSE